MHFLLSLIPYPYVGYKDDLNIPEDSIDNENKAIFEAAENIHAQVDAHGHAHTLLDSIITYDKDTSALS